MKHLLSLSLVFSFFLIIYSASAQQLTFEYVLRTSSNTQYFADLIETPSNDFFFCGGVSKIGNPYSAFSLIVKIDEYGNFVDSIQSKNGAQGSYCNSLINYAGDTLLSLSSVLSDSNGNDGFLLNLLNDGLLILDTATYIFPLKYKLESINASISNFGGKLLVGGAFKNGQALERPFLYVLNQYLDSIISKFYTEETGFAWKYNYLPSNQYWLFRAPSRYYLLDSALNIIADENVPDALGGNIGVKWDTDTSFYLLGQKTHSEPNYNLGFIRQFHPLDTEDHIFNNWGVSDTFDFPAAVNGIDFKYKDTIFIGGTRNLNLYNPYFAKQPSWFIILQADSMFNIRWERFYGGDAYYLMGKIIASNDGGCLIGGTRYDYLNESEEKRDIIILKLNAEGLLVSNSETPAIEMHEAIVYPNPGTTEIKVRIAAQYQEALFQLFDMNGKQVASKNIIGKWGTINTSFLKPGTYVYRISSEDGLFESGKWVKK